MIGPRNRARPSQHADRSNDPFTPNPQALAKGEIPFSTPFGHAERGTVISSDSARATYRVHLNSGRTMVMSRIKAHPGDNIMLPNGTPVVVMHDLGLPYIFGVLPFETPAPDLDTENPMTVTDTAGFGGSDPLLSGNLGSNARGTNEPRDLMPGDFVGMGPDGSSVAALGGQVAQLRGSPLAKVQAFGADDLIQIVSGVFRHISWMGESKITNDGGKTSYTWRGGSDQLTETGPDEQRYTIHLDVGATGNMIDLRVTNREGQSLFRFHVDPTGKVQLFASGGFNQFSGDGDGTINPVRFQGTLRQLVTRNHEVDIGGNQNIEVGGSNSERTSVNKEIIAGQDLSVSCNRNASYTADTERHVVSNGFSLLSSGDVTVEVRDQKIHSVKTTNGLAITETQGGQFQVLTGGGAITLDHGDGGLTLMNGGSDSIALGSFADAHVARWEELNLVLTAMNIQLNQMRVLLASHVHPVTLVPTPSALPAPTLAPIAAPIPFDISAAKSLTTKVR